MSTLSVVKASPKKPKDDEDQDEYSKPPARIKRDAFGYVTNGMTGENEGCHSCFFFDKGDSECELFEAIQGELPDLFQLDKKVAPNAGCKARIAKK